MAHIDPKLYEYATPRQCEILESLEQTGSGAATAAAMGVHRSLPQRTLKAVQAKAAKANYAPGTSNITAQVPAGFGVKRLSARFDKEGNAAGGWLISEPDKAAQHAALMQAIEDVCNGTPPAPLVPPPTLTDSDLLAVYPIGDPHFGAFGWAEETGEDYDLKIADAVHRKAIDWLVGIAPPAREALLINLGDMLHANDSKNMTPGHGNILDVDTRYEKVMMVAVDMMIYATYRLLEKHEKVTVWNVRGNHDPEAHFAIALAMRHHFRDNPRVDVNTKPADYLYYRFGNNLIGSHHGHGAKGADLPLLMATDRKEDWGQTEHRVWLCGHVHHKSMKEHPGCDVETFSTLAGKDAWHAQKGYRSKRGSSMIVYHRTDGEAVRYRVPVAALG